MDPTNEPGDESDGTGQAPVDGKGAEVAAPPAGTAGTDDADVAEPEPVDGEAIDPAPSADTAPSVRPATGRAGPSPTPVPAGGRPSAKQAGPVLAGVAVLWLLRVLLRRRRRR